MQINRISSKFNDSITYWTPDGKSNTVKYINYFYVEDYTKFLENDLVEIDLQNTHTNLEGNIVYKCTFTGNSFLYNKFKKQYAKHIYQNDISIDLLYMLDNNLSFSQDRTIMYFDIETKENKNDSQANTPQKATEPITSIVAATNKSDKMYVFAWHPIHTKQIADYDIQQQKDRIVFLCKDEYNMLICFTEMIQQLKIDIITGWYSHGYDMPYLYKRICHNGIAISNLAHDSNFWMSPMPYNNSYKFKIAGLDSVDMMDCIQYMHYNLQNNKLDTAAEMILGTEHMKLKSVSWRDWEDKFYEFLEYNIRDVIILKMIDQKVKLFDFLIELQCMSGCVKLNDVLSNTKQTDSYIIKRYYNKIVMPNVKKNERQSFMGAHVMEPQYPGVSKNVVSADFNSLYPTTGMWANISPEVFITSLSRCKNESEFENIVTELKENNISFVDTGYSNELIGKRYLFLAHNMQIGIIPEVWRELYLKRIELKKLMKNATNDADKALYNRQQLAVKIILNSLYGAMGFPAFRFFKIECCDAITHFGRKQLMYGIDYFNNNPLTTVNYGDTDSMYVILNNVDLKTSVAEFKNILTDLNRDIKINLIKKHNPNVPDDYLLTNLEHENTFTHAYFSNAKKRYIGLREDGSTYAHGIALIKKDISDTYKEMLSDAFIKILKDTFTYTDLENYFNKMKSITDYREVSIHKSINKDFHKYTKTMPGHVKSAMFAIDKLNLINAKFTDSWYQFQIISNCEEDIKPKLRNKAISLRPEDFKYIDTHKHIFELDYISIFEKQIITHIQEFIYAKTVGLVLDEWYTNHPTHYKKNKKDEWKFCG